MRRLPAIKRRLFLGGGIPRFRTFSDSLYARARVNVNLELSRSGNGVRNGFRRPDGVVADSSRNPLSTRSMWRATGADGAGFARRYWLSPNSANAWPLPLKNFVNGSPCLSKRQPACFCGLCFVRCEDILLRCGSAGALPPPSLGVSSLNLGRLHPRAALFSHSAAAR